MDSKSRCHCNHRTGWNTRLVICAIVTTICLALVTGRYWGQRHAGEYCTDAVTNVTAFCN
jgi:hypothetical protein